MEIYPINIPAKGDLRSFNFFLINNGKGLSLVDAGINSERCWQQFLESLNDNHFDLRDITEIILTHSHEDHTGLMSRVIDGNDIPVYVHPEAVPRLTRDVQFFERRTYFYEKLYREMGCGDEGNKRVKQLKEIMLNKQAEGIQANYRTLLENDIVIDMKVIETPGHAPDHIALLNERHKVMLGGDHLIAHISSNALIEPDKKGKRRKTVVEYVDSLQKCLSYDFDHCYSGHGESITDPHALIHKRLKGIEAKAGKFLHLVGKKEEITASEIAKKFYKEKYYTQFSLVMSEVIGHLDYLEHHNKVVKVLNNGVWLYRNREII